MKYKTMKTAQGSVNARNGDMSKKACPCCGEELEAGEVHNAWSVVTAQIADGHPSDTYFISSDEELIRQYARVVGPKMIYLSRYPTRAGAEAFAKKYLGRYAQIDPARSFLQ